MNTKRPATLFALESPSLATADCPFVYGAAALRIDGEYVNGVSGARKKSLSEAEARALTKLPVEMHGALLREAYMVLSFHPSARLSRLTQMSGALMSVPHPEGGQIHAVTRRQFLSFQYRVRRTIEQSKSPDEASLLIDEALDLCPLTIGDWRPNDRA